MDFSRENMRNSGNCIYDFAHSFFGEDFKSNALCWNVNIEPNINVDSCEIRAARMFLNTHNL